MDEMKAVWNFIRGNFGDISMVFVLVFMAYLTAGEKMAQWVFYCQLALMYVMGCYFKHYNKRIRKSLTKIQEKIESAKESRSKAVNIMAETPEYNRENWDRVMSQLSDDEIKDLAKHYFGRMGYEAYQLVRFIRANVPPNDAGELQDEWPLSIRGDESAVLEFCGRMHSLEVLCNSSLFQLGYAYIQMKEENEQKEEQKTA